MGAPNYPLINGVMYDFSSATAMLGPTPYGGFKAISYKDSLEGDLQYGSFAQAIGVTRGQYKAEASMEMYLEDWYALITELGDGFGTTFFPITVLFEEDVNSHVDELPSVRIKGQAKDYKPGADGLTVKVDLIVLEPILYDGLTIIDKLAA